MFLEWMTKYEPIWLALILLVSVSLEAYTARMAKKEYDYDEQKDLEKKSKRTRTTKKTTTQPSGVSTTEETSEIIEPPQEPKL